MAVETTLPPVPTGFRNVDAALSCHGDFGLARARGLAATYGERFEPPASLVEQAERGESCSDEQLAVAGA